MARSHLIKHFYLGVSIESDLKWNIHIDNIVKETKVLNFITINLKHCPIRIRKIIFSKLCLATVGILFNSLAYLLGKPQLLKC